MFHTVTIRGTRASLVWGYRPVATVVRWAVTKGEKGRWSLTAQLERSDAFLLRQRPLLFATPRDGKIGYGCWPLQELTIRPETNTLTATLGPPEY